MNSDLRPKPNITEEGSSSAESAFISYVPPTGAAFPGLGPLSRKNLSGLKTSGLGKMLSSLIICLSNAPSLSDSEKTWIGPTICLRQPLIRLESSSRGIVQPRWKNVGLLETHCQLARNIYSQGAFEPNGTGTNVLKHNRVNARYKLCSGRPAYRNISFIRQSM